MLKYTVYQQVTGRMGADIERPPATAVTAPGVWPEPTRSPDMVNISPPPPRTSRITSLKFGRP